MSTTIEATYDGQVFRPAGPVPLQGYRIKIGKVVVSGNR
jgi:hypothetical protein